MVRERVRNRERERERGEEKGCGVLQRDSVGSQSQWLVASQREKSLVRVFALDAREQMNPMSTSMFTSADAIRPLSLEKSSSDRTVTKLSFFSLHQSFLLSVKAQ